MKKLFINIIILSLFSTLLQAQAPGYLGKTFWAEADFASMIAFRGPNMNNKGLNSNYLFGGAERSFGLNVRYGGSLNFSLGRKLALGLTYHRANTGLSYYYQSNSDLFFPGYTLEDTSYYKDAHTVFHQVNSDIIGFKMYWYSGKKGGISPLGFFLSFSPAIAFSRSIEKDHYVSYGSPYMFQYNPNYYPGLSNPIDVSNLKINTLMFRFSLGRRYVLFDRITLAYELETALSFGKAGEFGGFDEQIRRRVRASNALYLNLGLGYLIF